MSKEIIVIPASSEVVLKESNASLAISSAGEQIKTLLLGRAGDIGTMAAPIERAMALELAGDIAGHLKQVEEDRKSIKDPYLRMGQAIDFAAKKHRVELDAALKNVNAAILAYDQAEVRKLQEAQRQADQQRQAAERAQIEAERKLQEVQEKAESERPRTPAEKAKELAEQLDAEDALEAAEAAQRIAASEAQTMQLARVATKGGRKSTQIEVVVDDIQKLYRARPDCVLMVPDVKKIKLLAEAGIDMPGVTVTKTEVFSAKAR